MLALLVIGWSFDNYGEVRVGTVSEEESGRVLASAWEIKMKEEWEKWTFLGLYTHVVVTTMPLHEIVPLSHVKRTLQSKHLSRILQYVSIFRVHQAWN